MKNNNSMFPISIEKVRELKSKNLVPASVSVSGNLNYAVKIFEDGNAALYRLITCTSKQRWQYVQCVFNAKNI